MRKRHRRAVLCGVVAWSNAAVHLFGFFDAAWRGTIFVKKTVTRSSFSFTATFTFPITSLTSLTEKYEKERAPHRSVFATIIASHLPAVDSGKVSLSAGWYRRGCRGIGLCRGG